MLLDVCAGLGKRAGLSKADLDTGWSKDDERQCSLCQKYGDLNPNVSVAVDKEITPIVRNKLLLKSEHPAL